VELRQRIFDALDAVVLIDPHTHLNPLSPASQTLADILGYHYYTELAHSAGMPREQIEEPGLEPREKCRRLFAHLGPTENTIQYSWFVEIARELFGFWDDRVGADNWEALYEAAAERMGRPDWAQQVLRQSRLEAVFLTNDFDDPLTGFDAAVYVPCLRSDDLVFQLANPEVRARLDRASGVSVTDADSLRAAIGRLFEHFVSRGARACAISLPPSFTPTRVTAGRAQTAVSEVWHRGLDAHATHRQALGHFVFWTLAEFAADYRLPFDLMIGAERGVYAAGVHQGRDLYDSRVSLIQYRELFNAFPQVTFPVSVLASVTNQELVSYAWIFPNVVTSGHWWYSNAPAFIERDLAARLEAVPATKQIGYYSDMYKLEFALPKFRMYKRVLAKVLAERFVIDRGWTEERAITFGKQVLRGNVDRVFPRPDPEARPRRAERDEGPEVAVALAGGAVGLAASVSAAEELVVEPLAQGPPVLPERAIEPLPPAIEPPEPGTEALPQEPATEALPQGEPPEPGTEALPQEPATEALPQGEPPAAAEAHDPLSFLGPRYSVAEPEPLESLDDLDLEPEDLLGPDRPPDTKQ
jgi:glucuronate isomerase